MDKDKLAPWVERLKKADKTDHIAIVAEMAGENSLKEEEAWQLLKPAGFEPPQSKLKPWIDRLKKADKSKHNAIVAEMARENFWKEADARKLLKLAGFELPDEPQPDQQDQPEAPKQSVVLRHKTEYPGYRRAGLVLTQKAETYEVTEEQLAELKKDRWVVFVDGKEDGEKK
jgi:hypothetical protein